MRINIRGSFRVDPQATDSPLVRSTPTHLLPVHVTNIVFAASPFFILARTIQLEPLSRNSAANGGVEDNVEIIEVLRRRTIHFCQWKVSVREPPRVWGWNWGETFAPSEARHIFNEGRAKQE